MSRTNSGGQAMSGGAEYQSRVSSWGCCHILLQTTFSNRFDLEDSIYPEKIYCETDDFVDDIRIEFRSGIKLFAQCKRSLSYSDRPNSDWAGVVKQFYHQYMNESRGETDYRLVLFLNNFNRNWSKLSQILTKCREEGALLENPQSSNLESDVVSKLNTLFNRLEEEFVEINDIKNELLKKIYIQHLDLSEDSETFTTIIDSLAHNIILNPHQARVTWDVIKAKTDSLHTYGGTTNRHQLRTLLKTRGIQLQDSLYFRNDFTTLNLFSQENYTYTDRFFSSIKIGSDSFTIQRQITPEMVDNESSYIILGEAGVGKTGITLSLYDELTSQGKKVWYWSVEKLQGETINELKTKLNLDNTWDDIFRELQTNTKPVLILDGLDGLKNFYYKKAYLDLIRKALLNQIQVIVSIRTFDLRYSIELRELFKNNARPYNNPSFNEEFKSVNHYQVSNLTDDELDQIREHFEQLDSILGNFSRLIPVLKNLYNLHILCNLISDNNSTLELSEISTQTQLFDLFWEKRIDSSEYRIRIINNLRTQINTIVAQNQLGSFSPEWNDEIHGYLCSTGILREHSRGTILIPGVVEFTHNLLFDYFAEKLYVLHSYSSNEREFINSLIANDTWTFFLRPSLRMFYLRLFKEDPNQLWGLLMSCEIQNVPLIQKYLIYLTIAENSVSFEDINKIIIGISSQEQVELWESVLKGVVNASVHSVLSELFSTGSGDWWLTFALTLTQIDNITCKDSNRRILYTASDNNETLSSQGLSLLNENSRHLLDYYWSNDIFENPITRLPIKCICESISSHQEESISLLRRILSSEELRRSGYTQAYEITRNIEKIWRASPTFAMEVYHRYTSYREVDQASTAINNSQILSLTSNKTQQYNSGFYLLTEKISDFLNEFPFEATGALIQSVENFVSRERILTRQNNFTWKNQECTIAYDYGNIWDYSDSHNHEVKMLSDMESYLISLPLKNDAEEIYMDIINRIINQNRLASVWRRLLLAGSKMPSFYATKLWDLLVINRILIQPELRESIKDCLEKFFPYLTEQNKIEVIEAILNITIDDAVVDDPTRITDIERNIKLDYLVCIPNEYQNETLQTYLQENIDEVPEQRRREIPFFRREVLSNEDIRRLEGINTDSSFYIELTNLSQFIDEIKKEHITQDNYQTLLSRVNYLESKLIELEDQIERELYQVIEKKILKGLSIIASSNIVFTQSELVALLERFNHELVINQNVTQEQLEAYDNPQGVWSSNDYYASKGIIHLSLNVNELTESLESSLNIISRHPKPVIKSNLGTNIFRFIDISPSFVWETIERWCEELRTTSGMKGVFKSLLLGNVNWFWILRRNDENRARNFLTQLHTSLRIINASEIINHYGGLIAVLYVRDNENWVEPELTNILENILDNQDEAMGAIELCNQFIFPRSPIDFDNLPILLKAKQLLVDLLQNSNQIIESSEEATQSQNTELIRNVFSFFSYTSTQFRVSSKVQSEYWLESNNESLNSETWWSLIDPILVQFEQLPHPNLIHDIIQGIESVIALDVVKSISWLNRLVVAGAPMNIVNEYLIVDKTVQLLETVLTSHTNLIIIDDDFRNNFIEIIEILLINGWPKVIQIAINLDSIYR